MARPKKNTTARSKGTTVTSKKAKAPVEEAPPVEVPAAEFSSVVITIDHLTQIKGEVVQKFVGSTEDVTTSLISLFNYYGDNAQLQSPATVKLFQLAAGATHGAFVYVTRRNTVEIVLDAHTFAALTAEYGSVLEATMNISNMAGQVLSEASVEERRALYFFEFSEEDVLVEEVEQEGEAAEA